MLNNKSILITGGTGSLGKALIKYIFKHYPNIKKIVVYSRDEQKQFQMAHEYPKDKYPQIRFFIGDVRDYARLKMAFETIDYVIHTAAMKHVDIAEYNPMECIKTNIHGAENIIQASLESNVEKVIALSTDKACSPVNLYGATKLVSDKLFISANNIKGSRKIKFSVVRYGNVLGSNGSVIPLFLKKRHTGLLPITDILMTRFNITLEQGIKTILFALENMYGLETFIPKILSYKLVDVAQAVAPNCKLEVVGIRPGEKLHEEMISVSDSYNTWDVGQYYVILPTELNFSLNNFIQRHDAKAFSKGISYSSNKNKQWETVESLRVLIKKHLDPNFLV